jgi:5-methylcytosine-specific restriction protein A
MAVKGRGYCETHVVVRVVEERPSPAERGYDYEWRKARARFLRSHPYCEVCGALATDADHRLPLRAGGTHDEGNLQALCHACHSRKTAREDGGFGNRGGGA